MLGGGLELLLVALVEERAQRGQRFGLVRSHLFVRSLLGEHDGGQIAAGFQVLARGVKPGWLSCLAWRRRLLWQRCGLQRFGF
ncbi:hypothetical protein CCR91_18145 [Thiorhodovibrio winogradskyi]|nr:hypothetical protein [Thiorhodovibrio winogradskyi]